MKIGDWVRVSTKRPHLERYDGQVGQIATFLPHQELAYVFLGRYRPVFYIDEIELINAEKEILL